MLCTLFYGQGSFLYFRLLFGGTMTRLFSSLVFVPMRDVAASVVETLPSRIKPRMETNLTRVMFSAQWLNTSSIEYYKNRNMK
ncbi:hypothetical protein VTL71DRAFT_1133 [Oculimacula yallundae]|uniref:Secreted protein n=1 Tax=Oculimacula yallundae TaxID=86028 RepID=A0ABR4D275_9HELO